MKEELSPEAVERMLNSYPTAPEEIKLLILETIEGLLPELIIGLREKHPWLATYTNSEGDFTFIMSLTISILRLRTKLD